MKPFIHLSGLLLLASLATACGGDTVTAPSSTTSATFTSHIHPGAAGALNLNGVARGQLTRAQ
jgi:hypothetical protein